MLYTAHQVWEPGSEYTFNPEKAERVIGRNDGGDAEDDDGVRVPIFPLVLRGCASSEHFACADKPAQLVELPDDDAIEGRLVPARSSLL
jgi:hypothetical protein